MTSGLQPPERVRVYEKVRQGIWVYTRLFHPEDAWMEESQSRHVCKFKLTLVDELPEAVHQQHIEHSKVSPTSVKIEVWERDQGRCVQCGAKDNLHFDHVIPFSKGGSSLTTSNIQLQCARHNLAKRDHLQ